MKELVILILAVIFSGKAAAYNDEPTYDSPDHKRITLILKNASTGTTEKSREEAQFRSIFDARTILAISKTSSFDIQTLTNTAIKLRSVGLKTSYLHPLVDEISRFGGNAYSLQKAAFILQVITNKRRFSMAMLDQLDDVIPGASNLMAHGIESSMENMTRRITIGNLDPLPAIALMMDEMTEESTGAAEKIMKASQK